MESIDKKEDHPMIVAAQAVFLASQQTKTPSLLLPKIEITPFNEEKQVESEINSIVYSACETIAIERLRLKILTNNLLIKKKISKTRKKVLAAKETFPEEKEFMDEAMEVLENHRYKKGIRKTVRILKKIQAIEEVAKERENESKKEEK